VLFLCVAADNATPAGTGDFLGHQRLKDDDRFHGHADMRSFTRDSHTPGEDASVAFGNHNFAPAEKIWFEARPLRRLVMVPKWTSYIFSCQLTGKLDDQIPKH
jgi:hypothetical protein